MRIMERIIEQENGCWIWTGAKFVNGYGYISIKRKNRLLHRVIYEHYRNEIPHGKVIDHLCRNKLCINPDHLEVVTQRDNVMRGEGIAAKNALKLTCPKGHQYSGISSTGQRICSTCDSKRLKEHYIRNKRMIILRQKYVYRKGLHKSGKNV
jgi:HNH endonuclease